MKDDPPEWFGFAILTAIGAIFALVFVLMGW